MIFGQFLRNLIVVVMFLFEGYLGERVVCDLGLWGARQLVFGSMVCLVPEGVDYILRLI